MQTNVVEGGDVLVSSVFDVSVGENSTITNSTCVTTPISLTTQSLTYGGEELEDEVSYRLMKIAGGLFSLLFATSIPVVYLIQRRIKRKKENSNNYVPLDIKLYM